MRPRKKPDIGWRDLGHGLVACLSPADRAAAQSRVEATWPGGPALATLSVRSGFDLALQCLALPRGSEVLVSAITIRDMAAILEHHGLRIVPVDVDPDTCAIDEARLALALTPRTRAILVAHLFGARMQMAGIAAFAQRHGLLLFEDCAQAFAADGYRGHAGSDVAMFSFGPIKTATALGGGVLCFRDPALRDACAERQRTHPVQPRLRYLTRALKYALIKTLCHPLPYTAFVAACRALGRSHDDFIGRAVRGFSGQGLIHGIRHQPCMPLLAVMRRRLRNASPADLAPRVAAAHQLASAMPGVPRAGSAAPTHVHWVFPIWSERPETLVRRLWHAGFDATRGATSLHAVAASATGAEDANEARRMIERVVYLPFDTLDARRLDRLAAIVVAFQRADGPAPALRPD